MRRRVTSDGLSVHSIAGSHVVLFGLDIEEPLLDGLLGFAVERTDPVEDERYWLRGYKVFESQAFGLTPAQPVSSREHPFQTFLWGDYTAKPDRDYEYRFVPLYGKPKKLEPGPEVTLPVTTEPEDDGEHGIWFNRGVIGSQAYTAKFGNREPSRDDATDPAYTWLSRGLIEAMLRFIREATDPRHSLRAAVYEFNYAPVLDALRAATDRGVDVKIVYDRRGKESDERPRVWQSTEPATAQAGITQSMIRRSTNSAIAHNKFVVLLEDGEPRAVWTGSTNFTRGGIFGQSNVGHCVRDTGIARAYLDYWQRLALDPEYRSLRAGNVAAQGTPPTPPPAGLTPIFSPRSDLSMIDWYAEQAANAQRSFFMTAAFGLHAKIADAIAPDSEVLRYLILEREQPDIAVGQDHDLKIAVGSFLRNGLLDRWTKERINTLNKHVRYTHTKFFLVDPLTDDPLVVTGSGNFSDPSVKSNDENMLVIRGNTRVADIFLGEYTRIFNHFYFRYLQQKLGRPAEATAYLSETDQWTRRYFDDTTPSYKQRLLFR